jgi:hypothetical protein
MLWIPGGSFLMGSNDFYTEEQPVHEVMVVGFWMDKHPVTNSEFRQFVEATGHVTIAERPPDPEQYPGIDPAALVPGSLVFRKPPQRVSLRDSKAWWAYIPGACWKSPQRARHQCLLTRRPPGDTRRLRRRNRVCSLGGKIIARRGRVGVRRARRALAGNFRLGKRICPRRPHHGQYMARRVSMAEPGCR